MAVPTYLPYYVLGSCVLIIAAILLGLRTALIRAAWPAPERNAVTGLAAAILVGWFIVALGLALLGAYRAAADRAPTIPYGILVPIVIGCALLWRSSTASRIVDAVPQPFMVGVQLYRALGGIFLVLYEAGRLPGLFAWPAGVGDVAVGLLAPLVASVYARRPMTAAGLVLGWNVLGLADLAVAVSTGFLTSPSPLQRFAFDLPSELLSAFPLVLIPTFLVPVSILLHVGSLMKLRRRRS